MTDIIARIDAVIAEHKANTTTEAVRSAAFEQAARNVRRFSPGGFIRAADYRANTVIIEDPAALPPQTSWWGRATALLRRDRGRNR